MIVFIKRLAHDPKSFHLIRVRHENKAYSTALVLPNTGWKRFIRLYVAIKKRLEKEAEQNQWTKARPVP